MTIEKRDGNAPNDPDQDYLHTDPVQRRKAQQMIGAMVAAAVLLWWLGLPALKQWMEVRDPAQFVQRMDLVCYVMSALLLATAGYSVWYARRIFHSRQFPPPGTWVLRDTRLLRGDPARARGLWVMTCGISCLVLALFCAIGLPRMFDGVVKASMQPPTGSAVFRPHG